MTSQVGPRVQVQSLGFFCRRNKIRGFLPTLRTDISETKKDIRIR